MGALQITNNFTEFKKYSLHSVTFEATLNGKTVQVTHITFEGRPTKINVIYRNAMHKMYKGFGRDFNSIDDAINGYKDATIQEILYAAKLK